MTRDEILDRYHKFRAISVHHHHEAMAFLSQHAVTDHAKRLGLAYRNTLVAANENEMTLVFDLALYTAASGRSRAVDRYARAAKLAPGSDESLVLEAMRRARFSIWRVEGPHETVGLRVTDIIRKAEAWLVDEGLEASAKRNTALALRICEPEGFAMTCGVIVPLDYDLLADVLLDSLSWRSDDPDRFAQDPRFATAIYRAAVNGGTMEHVEYRS